VFFDIDRRHVEILEPQSNDVIDRCLKKHDGGIHHLGFQTPDIDSTLKRATELEVKLIDETPREGAWSHQVGFRHPNSTYGVLIEFVASE
jgi:methylmalonyl-CoA/ethylmalonyl-CoA epimerase